MNKPSTAWTEKHRPTALEEMALTKGVREFFEALLTRKYPLPNILLHGPPGSGKTTLALILSQRIARQENVLELNASSDREIGTIRGKIKTFAASKSQTGEVKIIIMDECDYLTTDAQHCLRRIIEDTHKSTRFIFITNYINKIIDPIKSRLISVKIPWTGTEESTKILREIGEKESLNIREDEIKHILKITEGDMRKSLVLLQTAGLCKKAHGTDTKGIVDEISGIIPSSTVELITQAKTVTDITEAARIIARNGYSSIDVIHGLTEYLEGLDETVYTREIFKVLAACEEEILSGGCDSVHLLRIIASTADVLNRE